MARLDALIAAQQGCEAITEQLIAACCKLNLQIKNGWTPLFLAVDKGHASVTKQLIAARC
ncbi:MAG: ankyrin repeat domain-containing protein, partial [Brevundimonas sp.]